MVWTQELDWDDLVDRLKRRFARTGPISPVGREIPIRLATRSDIDIAQSELGFEIPSLLARCYLEVNDGGFGPGIYDIAGIFDGYHSWRSGDASGQGNWPNGLILVVAWGCDILSSIDCFDPGARVFRNDPNWDVGELRPLMQPWQYDERYAGVWGGSWVESPSLERWLGDWVDGADLFGKPFNDMHVAPAAPTNLAATALSSTSIQLTWSAPESGDLSYIVYQNARRSGRVWPRMVASDVLTTTYTVTGLNNNTMYYFDVAAKRVATGNRSNEVSAKTFG
jgi:hypothetical protein